MRTYILMKETRNCETLVSTQLESLVRLFTDPGDVVIDPCEGSGTTLLAAANLKRKAYGFEVNKQFFNDAKNKVLTRIQHELF